MQLQSTFNCLHQMFQAFFPASKTILGLFKHFKIEDLLKASLSFNAGMGTMYKLHSRVDSMRTHALSPFFVSLIWF